MTRATPDFRQSVSKLFDHLNAAPGPGAVVAVLEDGEEIFAGTYGLANINNSVPMARDTIIRIGSQTKQFTVLLTLMLEAEGKLSMSDPVQKHLPYVPVLDHEVTLFHLAQNTSGYRDHLEAMIFSGLSIFSPSTRQDGRDIISRQDSLNFAPGSAMAYCNAGFFMLSEIIEKIEGKSFNEVLIERITGPLGMKDTSLMRWDGTVMDRLATHYTKRANGWYNVGWGLDLGGEGGMVSTLNDMIIWQQNLWSPKVGTPDMYERMSTPCTFSNGAKGYYGLGLVTDIYHGRRAVGHGGTVAGGKSESTRFVDDGLGIVLITNSDQMATFSVGRRIADIYFDDATPDPIAFTPGRYRHDSSADMFEIVMVDGVPAFLSGGVTAFDFSHPGGAKPERAVTDIVLSPNEDGTISVLHSGTPRTYVPLADLARASRPLAGRYRNPSQGLEVEVTGDEARGTISIRSSLGALNGSLVALDHDLWAMLPAGAELQPGKPWSATILMTSDGFTLNTERLRNLSFIAA